MNDFKQAQEYARQFGESMPQRAYALQWQKAHTVENQGVLSNLPGILFAFCLPFGGPADIHQHVVRAPGHREFCMVRAEGL
jgi:hypothetical protein